MQLKLTQEGLTASRPRVAPRDARVCLVECYDAFYVRVFGPYPRAQALPKREAWNRKTPEHWRYEFWEDWDAAVAEHRRIERDYTEENRRDYICESLAHDTTPVYLVRLREGVQVEETFFGPVPRRVGRWGSVEGFSVLSLIAEYAAECFSEQLPSSVGGDKDLETILGLEWEAGHRLPRGSRSRRVPPQSEWPVFGDEPELMRNPEL